MPDGKIYEDDKPVPSEQFLAMIIILLRKCEMETGTSLVQFLEDFEQEHPDYNPNDDVDAYDDKSLRGAVNRYKLKMYPIKKPE